MNVSFNFTRTAGEIRKCDLEEGGREIRRNGVFHSKWRDEASRGEVREAREAKDSRRK